MIFSEPQKPAPKTTIRFHDESEEHPADWRPWLPAYDFSDWKADVYTGRTPGERALVTIRSALGVFEGEAIVQAVVIGDWPGEVRSELVGSGALRPSGGPTGGTPNG